MSTSSGILGSKYAALGAIILGAEDFGTVFTETVIDNVSVGESIGVRQTFIFQSVNDTATVSEISAASRDAAQGIYTGVLGSSYALLGDFVLGDLDPQISPYSRSVSDDPTVSEIIATRNTNVRITVSDTVTVAENIIPNKSINVSVSDTVNVTTTITERDNTVYITISDSATVAETRIGRNDTIRISVSDTAHCADTSFGRNNTIRITVTDSIHSTDGGSGRDSITRLTVTSLVHIVDTTIIRDTINRIHVSDTIHVMETVFQTSPNVNPVDHVHVSESITFTTSFVFITVHDNVHVAETLHCNPLDITVTDIVHVSTDFVNIKFYISPLNIGMTEPVFVKEKIVGHGPIVNAFVTDTVLVSEVILTNRPLYHVIDTITVTDILVTSPHTPMRVLDTITLHDTINFSVSPVRVTDRVKVTDKIFEYTTNVFITLIDHVATYDTVTFSILAVQRLVDHINVAEHIVSSNARQSVSDNLTVSENIHFSPVSISVSDSVTVTDKAQRLAFLIQDHITISENIGVELNSPGLIQKLDITDTLSFNQIVHRTVVDTIHVNEFMNLHGSIHVISIVDFLPINDGSHRTSVGGKIIIIPDLNGVIVNPKLMQLQTEDTQIQLPAAQFGDGKEVVGEVNVVKAMEGTTRQFIQQTARIRLTYKWKLSHIKVYELRAFVMASLSKIVTITDWNGVIYKTQIVKNPFEFANEGVYKAQKEFAEVEMIFEGIKTSGD